MSRRLRQRGRLLAAVCLALAGCSRGKSGAAPLVQTAPVQRQDIVVDVQATGVIAPINAVQVKSKASGQVIRMSVTIGSNVKPGDLLAQIDPRDVQSRYDQADASLKAALAGRAVADTQLAREQALFKQGVITATERETAVLSAANADAALVSARTNVNLAAINLADATVRAPIAGTVIEKDVSVGTVITSATASFGGGTTLLVMADLSTVQDSVLVNESDIGNVKAGQKASVRVDAYPNRVFQGTVEKIAPQATVQQSVTMFPVFIRLDNRDGALMPGMNSDVSVLVEQRDNVLAVPNDAVRSPRDAAAAAAALGLDANAVRQQLQTAMGGGGGAATAGGDSARRSGRTSTTGSAGTVGVAGAAGAAGQGRARRGAAATAGAGDAQLTVGGQEVPAGASAGGRPGLVFISKGKSFEPRVARLGLGNYDVTEVLSGLQEGDQVALISAAMLQQARGEMVNRIRSRTALPGMGGGSTPTGGTPSGGAPSGGAPSGRAPSGGAPSGGAPSGGTSSGGSPSGGTPGGGAPAGGAGGGRPPGPP